jgi:uncharacterized membrane protein YbhN (UPF0104 family)
VRRRRLLLAAQIVLGVVIVVFVGLEIARSWDRLGPRVADLAVLPIVVAALLLAAYYLAFVVGWMLILRAFGMRIGYRDAVGAEMVSMLAKYIPGGVWTPAARVVACQRLGMAPGPVLASIGYEAGLSAIAGVAVLAAALPFAPDVSLPVPAWALGLFVALLLVLLHPRIFGPLADRLLSRLGDGPLPRLPSATAGFVFLYYAGTWVLGGAALLAMTHALADVPLQAAPYLGGASALGAIAAVLVVFAPSGIGVREGAVYALLLAYVDRDTALVVVALNRILLTVVEAALLGAVALLRRYGARRPAPAAMSDVR